MAQQSQMFNKRLQQAHDPVNKKQLAPGQEPPDRAHNRVGESVQANPSQTAKQIEQQILQATETKMENDGVYRKSEAMRNMFNSPNQFAQSQKDAMQATAAAQKAHQKDVIMREASANAADDALKKAHDTIMFDTHQPKKSSQFGFDQVDKPKQAKTKKQHVETKQNQSTYRDSSKTLNPHDFHVNDDVIAMGENNDSVIPTPKMSYPKKQNVEKGITQNKDYAENAGAFLVKTNDQSDFVKFLQMKQGDILGYVGDKLGVSDEPSFATKQHVYIEPFSDKSNMTSCRVSYCGFDEVNVKNVDAAVRSVVKDMMDEYGETEVFMDKTRPVTHKYLSTMDAQTVKTDMPIHIDTEQTSTDIDPSMEPVEKQKEADGLSL